MSTPKLYFSSTAAKELRSLTDSERARALDQLSSGLVALRKGKDKRGAVVISGTKYVALPVGERTAVVRPMTHEEREKYGHQTRESYLVADLGRAGDLIEF